MTGIIYELKYPNGSYIGSTIRSIETRVKQHVYHLKKETHCNPILQRVYNMRGMFEVKILETINCDNITELRNREQEYLEQHRPLYNISKSAHYPNHYKDNIALYYDKELCKCNGAQGNILLILLTRKRISNKDKRLQNEECKINLDLNLVIYKEDKYELNEEFSLFLKNKIESL